MEKENILEILTNLKVKGGLVALLPQNLPYGLLTELYEMVRSIPENPKGDASDMLEIITYWFLYGRKMRMIAPSIMAQKVKILSLAITAEKFRRDGNRSMKEWPLPDIDNLFDDKGVNFYFYQDTTGILPEPNPLRIIDNPHLNTHHRLPDMINRYAKDLYAYYEAYNDMKGRVTLEEFISVIVYYTLDLLIEYKNNAGNILPQSIIADTKQQVISALQSNSDAFNNEEVINNIISQIDQRLFEPNIVHETEKFLQRIRDFG